MSKARGQRSIYVEEAAWERAKETAWKQRTSVSKLIVELLDKEAVRWNEEQETPKRKTAKQG